jgi:hypothetical protein
LVDAAGGKFCIVVYDGFKFGSLGFVEDFGMIRDEGLSRDRSQADLDDWDE